MRFWLRATLIGMALFGSVASAAAADEYVGGDGSGEAIYIAWTADDGGHIQGQVQIVSIDPANNARTKATNASFTGNRHGSDVSLAFPLLGAFGGTTWTGHVGWRRLTLHLPSTTGQPIDINLTAGDVDDFRRRIASLQTRANSANLTQALTRDVQDIVQQIKNEMDLIAAADKYLRREFPMPPPSPNNPRTIAGQYATAYAKMTGDWDREQSAAAVQPMTCYQKSQVAYIASTVAYDESQIKYLDGTMGSVLDQNDKQIAIAEHGPGVLRTLIEIYNRRADALHRNAGTPIRSASPLMSVAETAAAFARNTATPRQTRARAAVQDYDSRAEDVQAQASAFPDKVECDG